MPKHFLLLAFVPFVCSGQLTPFEKSDGKASATYAECIAYYRHLAASSSKLHIRQIGMSDAGYPYDLMLYSNDGSADPALWHKQHKIVLLINNGIHPGEPDGIDACMMLLRDIIQHKIAVPENVALAVIPVYNIGGSLNRNKYSRVNQQGPDSFGFRGNAQNLDLNRDFTKSDSRNAHSFAQIFHWVDPEIMIDNHVSDGADYQHTMTLITTQWNKLGGPLGKFVHDTFDPALFRDMEKRGWPMCPYVNFEDGSPEKGWTQFYDPPRYSSGYAALFNTIAFMPETHMLKPFKQRVLSTYALMQVMIAQASAHAAVIIQKRKDNFDLSLKQDSLAIAWMPDSTHYDSLQFKGYEAGKKASDVTGMPRLFYDHSKPFEKTVPYYDYFSASAWGRIPKTFVVPQGWHEAVDLLILNGVKVSRLMHDSDIAVQVSHIDSYKPSPRAYEKHHRNTDVRVSNAMATLHFLKGDYLIDTYQHMRRFVVEMLDPTADDSYFSWNFFDAILQQKEGYSDYRWEDVAAEYLSAHPELRKLLEEKKQADPKFAANGPAQLEFVYKHSPYYEPAHLRYPVYSIF